MSEDLTAKLPNNGKDEILTAINNLGTHITRIDDRLQRLEQKVDGLEKKVDGLDKKVEERLYDTRPIWHRVVADIALLQVGQQRLEQGQQAMRNELANVSRDQIVINDSIRKIQLDYHAIDNRLHQLEVNRN